MTVRIGPSLTDRVRAALATVKSNPSVIDSIAAADAAQAAAAEAEAKRLRSAGEKVDAALAKRTQDLVADFRAVQEAALTAAAEKLAREQLEREHGVIAPKVAIATWPPARLDQRRVDQALDKAVSEAPVPWDRSGRSAGRLRAEEFGKASAALEREAAAAVVVDDVEQRIADRRRSLEETRQRQIAERKAQARAAGTLPPAS